MHLSSLGSSTLINFSILIRNCLLLRLRTSNTLANIIMMAMTSTVTVATDIPIMMVVNLESSRRIIYSCNYIMAIICTFVYYYIKLDG